MGSAQFGPAWWVQRLTKTEVAAVRYELRVKGHLGRLSEAALGCRTVRSDGASTVIEVDVPDGSGLYSVLESLQELGLELLDVTLREPGPSSP